MNGPRGVPLHLNSPFGLTRHVVDQPASPDAYVEQLIEQVLFTVPGERVNRPDFGCGIQNLLFKPDNTALMTASLFLIRSQLESQLAGIVRIEHAEATTVDGELHVLIRYLLPGSEQRRTARFRR